MFKSRKMLYLTIAVLILVSLGLPFLFDENILNKINHGVSLVSAVSTVITLYIALILFNKFGVERKFLDKQFDVVVELLGEVKKLDFKMERKGNSRKTLFFNGSWKGIFHSKKRLGDEEVLFNISYFTEVSKIANYANNIYLPEEIALSLEKIAPHFLAEEKGDIRNKWIIYAKRGIPTGDEDCSGIINDKKLKYRDFYESWEAVIFECKRWLKKNSSIDIDFNC